MKTKYIVMCFCTATLITGCSKQKFTETAIVFGKNRSEQLSLISNKTDLPLPESTAGFFEASETGNWITISNSFKAFLKTGIPSDGIRSEVMNELWHPILETYITGRIRIQ